MRVRRVTCANPSVHVGDGALVAANASVAVPRCVCPPTAVSTTTTSAASKGTTGATAKPLPAPVAAALVEELFGVAPPSPTHDTHVARDGDRSHVDEPSAVDEWADGGAESFGRDRSHDHDRGHVQHGHHAGSSHPVAVHGGSSGGPSAAAPTSATTSVTAGATAVTGHATVSPATSGHPVQVVAAATTASLSSAAQQQHRPRHQYSLLQNSAATHPGSRPTGR